MTVSVSTALVLGALSAPEWRTLRAVALPEGRDGRSAVTVPHVVVGPGGIFVLDDCDWSGWLWLENGRLFRAVPVGPADGAAETGPAERAAGAAIGVQRGAVDAWDWDVRSGDEVVARAESLAGRVRAALPGYLARHVRAVLCLTDSDRVRGRAGDVVVCSCLTLPFLLRSRPPVLPRDGADEAVELLAGPDGAKPATEDATPAAQPAGEVPAGGMPRGEVPTQAVPVHELPADPGSGDEGDPASPRPHRPLRQSPPKRRGEPRPGAVSRLLHRPGPR